MLQPARLAPPPICPAYSSNSTSTSSPAPSGSGVLTIIGGVVIGGLGVFFQLLGQVGAWRASGNMVLVAILRNFQLLDKAHGPGRKILVRGGEHGSAIVLGNGSEVT